MQSQRSAKRAYGTGSIISSRNAWYGKWRVGDRQVKRKLGPKRQSGSRDGLTRKQAERTLRKLMEAEAAVVVVGVRRTVEEVTEAMTEHLVAIGRKPTTIENYRSLARTHLSRHLGNRRIDQVQPAEVERMVAAMRRAGAGPKLIRNALTLLQQVFAFAERRGWASFNPCKQIERPVVEPHADIRFLTLDEVEAMLRAVPDDSFGPTDRALFLTAAMTGLRQGELLALRWQDIDWAAGRLRVRRNYVRGHWGSPKSRRGIRSVPMVDRVAADLERHFQRSEYRADDDLVFPHPITGSVLDHSDLARRFKAALAAAGVRAVRFNDLRHTFATRMAGAGVPMRTLQEWLGHRDYATTLIYADYAPSAQEAELAERAFGGYQVSTNLNASGSNPEHEKPLEQAKPPPGT